MSKPGAPRSQRIKLVYTTGGPFFSDGRNAGHMSLSFASETLAALAKGVEQLASIARCLGARRRRRKA